MWGLRTEQPATRFRMDTSKAMALLGFSSSRTFDSTSMGEIQTSFMFRVHRLEGMPTHDAYSRQNKRDELRKLNEAYQHLRRKQKHFTGRSMQDNWQIVAGKGSVVQSVVALHDKVAGQSDHADEEPLPADLRPARLASIAGESLSSGGASGSSSESSFSTTKSYPKLAVTKSTTVARPRTVSSFSQNRRRISKSTTNLRAQDERAEEQNKLLKEILAKKEERPWRSAKGKPSSKTDQGKAELTLDAPSHHGAKSKSPKKKRRHRQTAALEAPVRRTLSPAEGESLRKALSNLSVSNLDIRTAARADRGGGGDGGGGYLSAWPS